MKLQRKIKRNIKRALTGAALAAMLITAPAFALPQTPNVIVGNGQITIDDGTGGVMNIAVGANGVIDWSSFSIAGGETVNFNFADTLAVLNRVTGNSMSELHGALNSTGANGSVFLVNPNGVLVGAGATINASNLVLSTLDVSNDKFMKWANGEVDTVSFAKREQDAIAKSVTVEGGAFSIEQNLDLIGGSVSIAPGVSIAIDGEVYLLAGDKVDRASDQVLSVASQKDNLVSVKGSLEAEGVWAQGGNVSVENAAMKGEWVDLIAAKQYTVGDTSDRISATSNNKLSITNSQITIDGDKNESVMLIGGQIAMTGSGISIDEGHHVSIIAGNDILLKWASEDMGELPISYTTFFRGADIIADSANTITLDNVLITNTPNAGSGSMNAPIFILGGKVDIKGISTLESGEVLIGAGSKLGVEADYDADNHRYWDKYNFADHFKSSAGNTVTFRNDTRLVANEEAQILGNSITNAGTIQAHGHYGLSLIAIDEINWDEETDTGYDIFSKNNRIVNTGTISADQENFHSSGWTIPDNVLNIEAGSIENTGTITASRHRDNDINNDTVSADILVVGTVTGSGSINMAEPSGEITQLDLDLDNYNYKFVWRDDVDEPIVEKLPLNGGPTNPTNPTIDDILNGSGSLADKQQQIIAVVHTINGLPADEQPAAVVGALHSILGQGSLSQNEKESLLSSVVNSYEGTAAGRTEANNQTTINQASTAGDTNNPAPAFTDGESEGSNVDFNNPTE